MPTKNKGEDAYFAQFNLSNRIQYAETPNHSDSIEMTMKMERNGKTVARFDGSLGKNGQISIDNETLIDGEAFADYSLDNVIGDGDCQFKHNSSKWDNKSERLKINLDDAKNDDNMLYNLEANNYGCKWKGFDGTIDRIKLMPIDEENANRWRDELLLQKAREDYLTKEDFEQEVSSINNDDEAFRDYKLHPLSFDDFTEKHKIDKRAFWHLKAPNDLSLN